MAAKAEKNYRMYTLDESREIYVDEHRTIVPFELLTTTLSKNVKLSKNSQFLGEVHVGENTIVGLKSTLYGNQSLV